MLVLAARQRFSRLQSQFTAKNKKLRDAPNVLSHNPANNAHSGGLELASASACRVPPAFLFVPPPHRQILLFEKSINFMLYG
jgi:hypothetical protein